jgi:hypothetical protein
LFLSSFFSLFPLFFSSVLVCSCSTCSCST